ncbi:hypothetical protein Glove_236g27 [Diversispora epigaea]|uniref:Uncharacterized protein n=1 Tax=Diversispora epigaea TaxID=1348612 RepID=A0A397IIN8_9GLOM|nr:hypothetical protein Glove_236g27 [Diversispora epigaea]
MDKECQEEGNDDRLSIKKKKKQNDNSCYFISTQIEIKQFNEKKIIEDCIITRFWKSVNLPENGLKHLVDGIMHCCFAKMTINHLYGVGMTGRKNEFGKIHDTLKEWVLTQVGDLYTFGFSNWIRTTLENSELRDSGKVSIFLKMIFDRLSNDLTQLLASGVNYDVSIEIASYKLELDELVEHLQIFLALPTTILHGETEEFEQKILMKVTSCKRELDELVEHLQICLALPTTILHASYKVELDELVEHLQIFLALPTTILHGETEEFEQKILMKVTSYKLELDELVERLQICLALPTTILHGETEEFEQKILMKITSYKLELDELVEHLQICLALPTTILHGETEEFEQKILMKINITIKFITPNKPISLIILPPRRISNITLPTRIFPILLPSNIITDEHALEISSWIDEKEIPSQIFHFYCLSNTLKIN